jgi:hypothetical protein
MPIDLVSTEDFSKISKGAKDAPKAETPKPLVEKKAEHAGMQGRGHDRRFGLALHHLLGYLPCSNSVTSATR